MEGFEFLGSEHITLPHPEAVSTAYIRSLNIDAVISGGFVRGYVRYKHAMWPIGALYLTDSLYNQVLELVKTRNIIVKFQHKAENLTYQSSQWGVTDSEALQRLIEEIVQVSTFN